MVKTIFVIMTHVSFIVLLVLFSCVATSGQEHDDDYVDPTDLFNFDPASVSMKSKTSKKPNTVNVDTDSFSKDKNDVCEQSDTCDVPSHLRKFENGAKNSDFDAGKQKKDAGRDQECSKIKQSLESSIALSRQYVNKLVHLLEPKVGTASSPVEINLLLRVSYHDIVKLRKFGQGSSDQIHDVYEILNSVVQFASESIQPQSSIYWLEVKTGLSSEVLWKVLSVCCCILLILIVLSQLMVTRKMMYQLLFIIFTISVIFNWIELYQKQLAEQDKILMMEKLSDRCPKMDELSFFSRITTYLSLTFTFQDESCREYFQAMVVSPLVKASPIEAVSVAFVKTIVTPFETIGTGIKAFFVGLLKDLPLQYQMLVLIILFVIVILLLFFSCGYYLRIFGVISLGPSENRRAVQGPAYSSQHRIENGADHIQQGIPHHQLMGLEGHQMINNGLPVVQRDGPRTGLNQSAALGQVEHGERQRQNHNIPGNVNRTDCEGTLPAVNQPTARETNRTEEKVADFGLICMQECGDGCSPVAAAVPSSAAHAHLSKGKVTDSGQQCKKEGDCSSLSAATVGSSAAHADLSKGKVTVCGQQCKKKADGSSLEAAAVVTSVTHTDPSNGKINDSGQQCKKKADGDSLVAAAVVRSATLTDPSQEETTVCGQQCKNEGDNGSLEAAAVVSSEGHANLSKEKVTDIDGYNKQVAAVGGPEALSSLRED